MRLTVTTRARRVRMLIARAGQLGQEAHLTDVPKALPKIEGIPAVTMTCEGCGTGNVLSWLEANVVPGDLAVRRAFRENLQRMLG